MKAESLLDEIMEMPPTPEQEAFYARRHALLNAQVKWQEDNAASGVLTGIPADVMAAKAEIDAEYVDEEWLAYLQQERDKTCSR